MISKVTTPKTELIINIFLLLGVLVFLGGASQYFQFRQAGKAPTNTSEEAFTLIERKQAIEEAEKNGQKDYSYSTGFNPGISGQ